MDSTSHDPPRIPPEMARHGSTTPPSLRHQQQQHQPQPSQNVAGAKFSYLMTPEEQTASSFSHDAHDEKRPRLPPLHGLASPPTSPAFQTLPNITDVTGYSPSPPHQHSDDYTSGFGSSTVRSHHPTPTFGDAALFPPETERRSSNSPLFNNTQEPKAARSNAIAATSSPGSVSHLSREYAAFTLDFPFNLGIKTPKQATDYWRSCCADATKVGRIQLPVPRGSPTSRDPISVRQLQSIERTHRVPRTAVRPQRTTKPVTHERKPSAAARRAARSKPPVPLLGETPIVVAHSKAHDDKVAKHRRAPATKPRPVGENWADVPDYSPPVSSLATAPKPLKARPVGTSGPLDLSNDPDRAHLHPDELQVAATLRLQCAKYLLNKRKIFKAKVEHLQGAAMANFNKTEAQKACTIDVNKASSLYQAFEDVGWFRKSWFEQYL